LIYYTNDEKDKGKARNVLKQLQECDLYTRAAKCHFGTPEVRFLRFVIGSVGIGMELYQVSTVEHWPMPESVLGVPVLLGFTSCYQQFNRKFTRVITQISDLIHKQSYPTHLLT
jgi:hypothetical protein